MVVAALRHKLFPVVVVLVIIVTYSCCYYYCYFTNGTSSILQVTVQRASVQSSAEGYLGNTSSLLLLKEASQRSAKRCGLAENYRQQNHLIPPIDANCSLLAAGDSAELLRVQQFIKTSSPTFSDSQLYHLLQNCTYVKELFSTDNVYISEAEEAFPIAYVLVFHTQPLQIIRFLQSVYRPHNVYCLHPDVKTGQDFANAFRNLAECLPNIAVPSKLLKVTYKHSSILEAQLTCLSELFRFKEKSWCYALTLCGRELPFSTNRMIVDRLSALNDSSLVGAKFSKDSKRRFMFKNVVHQKTGILRRTRTRLGPIPYGITLYKSSDYLALSRKFLQFIFTNKKAKALRQYMKDVRIPEEHFYASLIKLPEAPGNGGGGGGGGGGELTVSKAYWESPQNTCSGKSVHQVCILNIADLPKLVREGSGNRKTIFFYNKYFMEEDPVIMQCIEERLATMNMLECKQDKTVSNKEK